MPEEVQQRGFRASPLQIDAWKRRTSVYLIFDDDVFGSGACCYGPCDYHRPCDSLRRHLMFFYLDLAVVFPGKLSRLSIIVINSG